MTDKQIFANAFHFEFAGSSLKKAWYTGRMHGFVPERPNNLTKWDIACALEKLSNPCMYWTLIYDAFTKTQLLVILQEKCESYAYSTSQV